MGNLNLLSYEGRIMELKASILKLLKEHTVSSDISYTLQEKQNKYYCVISTKVDNKWKNIWKTTGIFAERGNLRKANSKAKEISDEFISIVNDFNESKPSTTTEMNFEKNN